MMTLNFILGLVMIATLYSCVFENLRKGEVLTWYLTPTLIIKTKLGERNELLQRKSTPIQFRLDQDKYVGNFPYGYQPKKQEKLDAETLSKIEKSKYSSSVRSHKSRDVIFDIALNGSKFKTNDYAINNPYSRVHKDQVSVQLEKINSIHNSVMSESEVKKGTYDTKLSSELGLECYNIEKSYTYNEKTTNFNISYCLGYPKDKSLPVVHSSFEKLDPKTFRFSTNSEKYGVNISWIVDRSHLKDWEKIHKEIYRIIDIWNVAPQSATEAHKKTS